MSLRSLTPDSDELTDSPATSTSSGGRSERWLFQGLLERKTFRSQETVTIKLPASGLRAPFNQDAALPFDEKRRVTPVMVAARGNGQRARFLEEEEDLLVELKERKNPKLSGKEIHRHFSTRTIGSLRMHYSTQLKERHISRRRTVKC